MTSIMKHELSFFAAMIGAIANPSLEDSLGHCYLRNPGIDTLAAANTR